MKIIQITPEVYPFSKTGGLADVVEALSKGLFDKGHDVSVFSPLYKCVKENFKNLIETGVEINVNLGGKEVKGRILRSSFPNTIVPVYFLSYDPYFNRDGLYNYDGRDYDDNAERYIFFSRSSVEFMKAMNVNPDIVHCHEWQSALVPVYLKTLYNNTQNFSKTKTVQTIHNIAYQGIFWHWDMKLTGLDWGLFNFKQLEYYGKLNFLKGGIVFSDAITTVSKKYAEEIQTKEFGAGLEDVLTYKRDFLYGIMNGVDYTNWNPSTDKFLPMRYSEKNLRGKTRCKNVLKKECGLKAVEAPLIGVISRLAEQKGIDILLECFDRIMGLGVQIIILGVGDKGYENSLKEMEDSYKGMVSVNLRFDERLAHLIEAGADIFLMPSRFEPCGLNQLYSMKYGTVPIVRETGGLADSVVDCNSITLANNSASGFVFKEYSAEELLNCIKRALELFKNKKLWRKLIISCMQKDFSWNKSVDEYIKLYSKL